MIGLNCLYRFIFLIIGEILFHDDVDGHHVVSFRHIPVVKQILDHGFYGIEALQLRTLAEQGCDRAVFDTSDVVGSQVERDDLNVVDPMVPQNVGYDIAS